ncbi:D-mannonate dehydratase [Candidatus Poribacteria bacterium]|nr:D-mannonate dehydratase [Candidatus Poribacteria bacterium]
MKLGVSHQRPEMLTPGYLNYLKQMGVESLEIRLPARDSGYENLVRIKQKVEDAGFNVFEIMLADKYTSRKFALGLPGRDEEIEFFNAFIKDLSKAGIDCTTYAWDTGGIYTTGRTMTRGCQTRYFQLEEALKSPITLDREYTDDEMWDNYKYFIESVLPVAEDAGVRLQLHPNDPPVTHQGAARIFRSNEAFSRAMEISNHSPYSGILFCVGTWGEMFGPDGNGEDIVGAIHKFGSKGHIYQVHFRNVSSPMPDFYETFPDNGYLNMYKIMKALGEVNFDGMVVPDHVPVCIDSEAGPKAAEAYIFGYIRALMQAAETELNHK